ncbi:hypothetical protein CLV84_2873 [Neolewinella xylanilytica]|uniref:Uncharacterized protein n=1 Tax=Neolewinella xylanilytica TaxID=1514080 RepID=A0A2S6I474_9BACT|nr:hypothetical protein [Neolewinella xylanilytica]PPK85960.1 hypothetical protein CLV84_2873 [Neolewinella xylanilytica]
MSILNRIFLFAFTLLLSGKQLLAQAEGESPYSSSTVDAPPGGSFFNTYGVVIVCGVIFIGLLLFVFLRGRTRS